MDIVLNTYFNNPKLPVVPLPGFVDDFNRPAADTLGETLDGKAWSLHSYSNSHAVWGTYGDGTAGMKSSGPYFHLAVADALVANGTLRATVSAIDETAENNRAGLAVRATDANNYISIAAIDPTNDRLAIQKRIDGSVSNVATAEQSLAPGDQLAVNLRGSSVEVILNGATILSAAIPEFTDVSNHGFYAFTGSAITWDHVEFVTD